MSILEKGHIADMFHGGTKKFYRVQVLQEITAGEMEGPHYEYRPITTFGGIAGGNSAPGNLGAPRQLRVGIRPSGAAPNWRMKCIDLLASQGGGAALNTIIEEGHDKDGVDYESLYRGWSKPKQDNDPGDCHE
jgi:hypothetical protein